MQSGQGSRRPAESAFKQQKLKAWQPILTPKWVIGCFTVVGTVFIPIGIAVLLASKSVLEYSIPYGANTVNCPVRSYTQPCIVSFTLPNQAGWSSQEVFVYYELDNFYQNHRRYVQSRAALQLSGDDMKLNGGQTDDLQSVFASFSDCQGFVSSFSDQTPNQTNTFYTAPTVYMYPCGLVAGSRQSDNSFVEGWQTSCQGFPGSNGNLCPRNPSGVAWPSDVAKKFAAPTVKWIAHNCRYIGGIDSGWIDPQLWNGSLVKLVPVSACNLQPSDFTAFHLLKEKGTRAGPSCGYRVYSDIAGSGTFTPNKGIYNCWQNVSDEDFIVWMRVAALPTFKKLYRKIPQVLLLAYKYVPTGNNFEVQNRARYNQMAFGGKKSIVLSTTTWIGGKNDFLGSAYIAVGAICIGLALVFLAKHLISPRKLGDPTYLDFNK